MRLLFLVLSIMCLFSCKDSTPDHILGEEKMKIVLWDYLNADVYAREFLADSSKDDTLVNAKLQQQLFKKNGVTSKQFYDSYEYYVQHPGKLLLMMDSMEAQQKRKDSLFNFKKTLPVEDVE